MVYISGANASHRYSQTRANAPTLPIGDNMDSFVKNLKALLADERVVMALGVLALAVIESAADKRIED